MKGNFSNYPAGTENDPDAPWNRVDPEERDFEIEIMATLTRWVTITTNEYTDDGKLDLTLKEQAELADEQPHGLSSLLNELARRLKKDIEAVEESDLTKRQKELKLNVLKSQLRDCRAWNVELIEVI